MFTLIDTAYRLPGDEPDIHRPASDCAAICREGVLASIRWVVKLWLSMCSVAAFLMPAMCLAEVNARFNCRGDCGLIFGLPTDRQSLLAAMRGENSHPSGRGSSQYW